MKTTAIYPNRIRDKQDLEEKTGLQEFGNESKVFYTPKMNLFAIGYVRVVYGNHGPYIEFSRTHVIMKLRKRFGPEPAGDDYFYE